MRAWTRAGKRWLVAPLLVSTFGCADSSNSPLPVSPEARLSVARFELSGTILGPVTMDDDSDMSISLREIGGGEAAINFIRLTCTNGAQVEWGAGGIVRERGTNRVLPFDSVRLIRPYRCPNSGRPIELLADLTEPMGNKITAIATPDPPGLDALSTVALAATKTPPVSIVI